LQEYEANIENLGEKLNQSIGNKHKLTSHIKVRDQAINQLKVEVNTLDSRITTMSVRAKKAQTNQEELENSLKIKETELQSLLSHSQEQESTITQMRNQATQMLENIQGITNQIDERDRTINQLQEAVNYRDREIQEWRTHSEDTQTKILELETRYIEKEQEITTLEKRIHSMQDNLTIVSGIGPKVSFILRTARITTFTKLAALNAKKIQKILEKENPQLLQLVDPTTWPEQAGLASTGEWENLKSLQNSLKGKRSTITEELIDMETTQITTNNPTTNQ
jgi:predicted flap endonuclease-1-like 5' DNA nuclease